jgi:SAM-dependent MidA family methyltransferase
MSLKEEIAALIAAEGPISVARYIELALGHPRFGYYITRDPFGAGGDFVTAPEISQMFGELIGLWAAHVWQVMGSPPAVRLVECGPGRGTLMADALRAARAVPAFRAALSVHLVETSPALRAAQGRLLADAAPRWHERLDTALEGPVIVIANEFLDALPVHQFQATAQGWRERLVGLAPDGALAFGLAPAVSAPLVGTVEPGSIIERSPAQEAVIAQVAAHVATAGGAALFIDYGASESGTGDTLQAVSRHVFVDPLARPGEVDLTTQVDFARLKMVAQRGGAAVQGPVRQGAFLDELGLSVRAERLSARATPTQAADLAAAVKRMTDAGPTGMGELFKAMAVANPALLPLPGFDSAPPAGA